jgi:hypothetical protein
MAVHLPYTAIIIVSSQHEMQRISTESQECGLAREICQLARFAFESTPKCIASTLRVTWLATQPAEAQIAVILPDKSQPE